MRRSYYIVALIFLIFFVISFLTNIIGPLVPAIIQDFDLNLTLVALLPFAFFIAYGVMSILAQGRKKLRGKFLLSLRPLRAVSRPGL